MIFGIIRVNFKKPTCLSMEELLSNFLEQLKNQKYSNRTISVYLNCMNQFLLQQNIETKDQVTFESVENFLGWWIKEKNISFSYQKQFLGAVHKFAVINDLVLGDLKKLYPHRVEANSPVYLSQKQMMYMTKSTLDLKHKSVLHLLYFAGLRVSEILNTKPEDVDFNSKLLRIHSQYKYREMKLSDEVLGGLKTYLREENPQTFLFEESNGEPLTVNLLSEIVLKAAQRVGIKKKVTPQSLRYSRATHLLEKGASFEEVQELLGCNVNLFPMDEDIKKNKARSFGNSLEQWKNE
ncbi:MAG: hypothetical protein C4K58_04090 [Flavobacteriaceae bacterium]|nr:MAG: hypothetical protein C4K58_04090 [Flavobacteriaceae bacterium]